MVNTQIRFLGTTADEYKKIKLEEKDLISKDLMNQFSNITNKSNNTLIHSNILR
jgi:hypothetical protein